MAIQYTLPTPDDLMALAERRDHSVTIYVRTSPIVSERQASIVTAKSAFDAAIDAVAQSDASTADRMALEREWESIIGNDDLWGHLAKSLAVFLAPGFSELFVLPNELESSWQVAPYFDTGQLLRATSFAQTAYALLLSAHGWSLWLGRASRRAEKMELTGQYPVDLDDATNREQDADPDNVRRLIGEEGRKVLLEAYAKRVSDATAAELNAIGDRGTVVFVFAAEPLLGMVHERGIKGHPLELIAGAPDRLGSAGIDAAIRDRLDARNIEKVAKTVDTFADGFSSGLVATQLSTIARAASASAIATLVFDFTTTVNGTFDAGTGVVELAPDDGRRFGTGAAAYDVLSAIADTVLQRGGTVIAVRPGEVSSSLWDGVAIAGLRFALA